jgi:glutamate/aspartate transport system substrate-binding protein
MGKRMMRQRKPEGRSAFFAFLSFIVIILSAAAVQAGTLDKIRSSGSIALGYRTASPPFSSTEVGAQPAGYSIDLCLRIVAAVKQATGLDKLSVAYVPVTPENRIEKLEAGEIDIECGSTTRTLSRQERVDFTLLTFVTGAELLVRLGSNINRLADLEGKKVAVLPGTTTDNTVRGELKQQFINATVVAVRDHDEGVAALVDGRADAYASDEVILIGLARKLGDNANLRLSGSIFSYEPYALMVRKNDADFRLVADRALAEIFRSGGIGGIWERWFGKWVARPNAHLMALYRLNGLPD